jgi:hypothetical protein
MKEIAIGIIAAVLGGLITYFGGIQAGIITKFEANKAAEQIIKNDDLRNYLIRSMSDSEKFKGAQGVPGQPGATGAPGTPGTQGPQGLPGELKTTQLQALRFAVCQSQNIGRCCDHIGANTKTAFPQLKKTCP